MTKDEALRLALRAMVINNQAWKHLADSGDAGYWEAEEQECYQLNEQAITAIKVALEAKDEPVAWFWFDERDGGEWIHIADNQINADKFGNAKVIPLYTTPPQRKPLSEEEIGAILEDVNAYGTRLYTFARAIEAAHGIKGEA